MPQLSSGRGQISRGTIWGVSGGLKHPVPTSLQLSASIFSSPSTSVFHHSLWCCPVLQLPLKMRPLQRPLYLPVVPVGKGLDRLLITSLLLAMPAGARV